MLRIVSSPNYRSGYLPVSIDHQLYYEDVGDPKLDCLVFVHGGPGLGCEEKHRHHFDLSKYRVILLDQRGSGRSTSMGEVSNNTTDFLVRDLEILRKRLQLGKITLLGSSWGAVPATLYAAQHPDSVKRLILKSPFLARQTDYNWAYSPGGVAQYLPRQWMDFSLNGAFQGEALVKSYFDAIIKQEVPPENRDNLCCRWLNWEGAQYFFRRPAEQVSLSPSTLSDYWKNVARIQIWYAKHKFYLPPEGILPEIARLAKTQIPCLILQGDSDIVTPPAGAQEIKKIWPQSELRLIKGADHKIPESEVYKV